MTTFRERHQGSVRSSDDLRDRRRGRTRCQTNSTSGSPPGGELDRRELLKKAGAVGAGAVVAGSLTGGTAKAATKRPRATPIKRGGRLVWGLESDPAHVAPFGGILTANHWAKEFAYDSLVEWDRQPERQAGARREVRDPQQDADPLDAEAGHQVPQRQGSHGGRRQVLGREDAEPAAAGQHLHRRPGAGDRQGPGRLEVRLHPAPEAVRRPRHRLLRLAAVRADRPGRPLRPGQRRAERDRHRPVPDARLRAERPHRVRAGTRTSGRRASRT